MARNLTAESRLRCRVLRVLPQIKDNMLSMFNHVGLPYLQMMDAAGVTQDPASNPFFDMFQVMFALQVGGHPTQPPCCTNKSWEVIWPNCPALKI